MGYIKSPFGAPLPAKPVEVKNTATGALIQTGATNSEGRWEFTLADETIAYTVEIAAGGGSGQKVAQAPASTEHEYVFIRNGLKVATGATVDLPAGTTVGGAPVGTSYVLKAGDTMTGGLTLTTLTASGVATVGSTLTVTGISQLNGAAQVLRPTLPTHGLIYFGNTATRYLLWDATRLASQDMPVSIITSGTASSSALTVSGSPGANDSSMQIVHAGVRNYILGVEGSRAVVAPYAGFFIHDASAATTRLSIRYNTGAVGIGAVAAGGASAQLDVQSTDAATPALIARSHASFPDTSAIFEVKNRLGTTVFGARQNGLVSDSYSSWSGGAVTREIFVFNTAGVLIGRIPLYL